MSTQFLLLFFGACSLGIVTLVLLAFALLTMGEVAKGGARGKALRGRGVGGRRWADRPGLRKSAGKIGDQSPGAPADDREGLATGDDALVTWEGEGGSIRAPA